MFHAVGSLPPFQHSDPEFTPDPPKRDGLTEKVVAWIGQTRTDLEETKAIRRYLVSRRRP